MTPYIVLKQKAPNSPNEQVSGAGGWFSAGPPVEAVSAEQAIRKAVDSENKGGGTFVAIPVRSFQPVTVTVETKRTLSIA